MTIQNRTAHVRVVTKVCRNPDFDRRVKYGEGRIETVEPGTRIIVRTWDEDFLGDGALVKQTRVELVRGEAMNPTFSNRKFCDELIAESEKVEIGSYNEFAQVNDNAGDHINRRILSLLWANPETRAAVEAAYREADTYEDDEA